MREVKHNTQAIAAAHQLSPGTRQPRPRIGRMRKLERHALRENIGPTPHQPERTQAHAIKYLERIKVCVNPLGTLHMHDGYMNIMRQAVFHFLDSMHHLDLSLRFGLQSEEVR